MAPGTWVCVMYHDVTAKAPVSQGWRQRFAVSLGSFERTLDAVTAAGFRGCSLEEALEEQHGPRVAITFDDGTLGQFEHAAPALRARGMTATFFVTTDWIGLPGYMSWDDLKQLVAWGMSVQSHTRSHPFLSELPAVDLRSELVESRAILDRQLGQQTTQIALPGGDAPAKHMQSLLWESGYRVVAGSRWGRNRDTAWAAGRPLFIRRCTVRGDVSRSLARRLVTGDPWLAITRGPRELVLANVRSALGPTCYSRWRRRLLNLLTRVNT